MNNTHPTAPGMNNKHLETTRKCRKVSFHHSELSRTFPNISNHFRPKNKTLSRTCGNPCLIGLQPISAWRLLDSLEGLTHAVLQHACHFATPGVYFPHRVALCRGGHLHKQ